MPVESKPLFRPRVVRPRLRAFAPERDLAEGRERLRAWSELLESPAARRQTEQELLPDFLTDVFYRVLGYSGPSGGGGTYTLSRERHVEVDGKFADAVLGCFGGGRDRFVAVVEGKGPRDPLERPFGGRRMSAVDQAYRYAINLPCDWILVTNLREIRLYHKGSDQRTYERFETSRLAEDDDHLRRFVLLLGAARVVPAEGPDHLDELRAASDHADRELTRTFYSEYSKIRRDVLERLQAANPRVVPEVLLFYTQKLLDRVLFCAFAEDRGLLPEETLRGAARHRDPYNPKPLWETFKGLFRSIDGGSPTLRIPSYNGGLFASDPGLDRLMVPDEVFAHFERLGDYDYRAPADIEDAEEAGESLVDVEILGHIFEKSITDVERLQEELKTGESGSRRGVSRRKREGAFYTPAAITRFIVGKALGPVLADRFETLRRSHHLRARATAVKPLDDPRVYDLDELNAPQRDALAAFWDSWIAELETVRVLDPACGSGAFLIEAFDQLHAAYQDANDRLQELRGTGPTLFDPDRSILRNNLFGVDLNEEAIQICRLSIWIKTAQRGKKLTDLDHNIRVGNSLVDDPAVEPRAPFDWRQEFPEIFAAGGFDVVVGNPPYVRQELLGALKPYLQRTYAAYHGVADLYVYFFERGLDLLRPGGRLSYVVTNKWMKAGYAEPLRRLLAERAATESVVDLGHAKQIFEDADVFPSIVVFRKPAELEVEADARGGAEGGTVRVCTIPREQLRIDDLEVQVEQEGFDLPLEELGGEPWVMEPPGVAALMKKINESGQPLTEVVGAPPLYGLKTGFNEAYVIDTERKAELAALDPGAIDLFRPFLRGQDVGRWRCRWAGLWMIVIESSENRRWPWSDAADSAAAEQIFGATYPGLYRHFRSHEARLRRRQDQGRFWWELRSCTYYEGFTRPKIFYQEIQYHPSYGLDRQGRYGNNKTFFIPSDDRFLLAALNSPLIWWFNWRYLPHMKDEALTPATYKVESLPIAPAGSLNDEVSTLTDRRLEIDVEIESGQSMLLDWFRLEHGIDRPSQRLRQPFTASADQLVAEVRRLRGKKRPLSAAAVRNLREEHERTIVPARALLAEAVRLERRLAELVNEAYGLTAEEVDLMWRTAPPRMPTAPPDEED